MGSGGAGGGLSPAWRAAATRAAAADRCRPPCAACVHAATAWRGGTRAVTERGRPSREGCRCRAAQTPARRSAHARDVGQWGDSRPDPSPPPSKAPAGGNKPVFFSSRFFSFENRPRVSRPPTPPPRTAIARRPPKGRQLLHGPPHRHRRPPHRHRRSPHRHHRPPRRHRGCRPGAGPRAPQPAAAPNGHAAIAHPAQPIRAPAGGPRFAVPAAATAAQGRCCSGGSDRRRGRQPQWRRRWVAAACRQRQGGRNGPPRARRGGVAGGPPPPSPGYVRTW